MARPIKQGLDYFPIDVSFFHNKKTKNLRRAKGAIGVLTYINLMCRIYESGYYYRFDDLEELSMDIAEEITHEQLRSTSARVTETINYLVGRGALDEGLFKQGIISGVALQEQYAISAYKAKRKIEMDVHCLVDVNEVIAKNRFNSEETAVNTEETQVNAEESTQSKSKSKSKGKVNESKDKPNGLSQTTTTTSTLSIARTREKTPPSDMSIAEYFYKRLSEESAGTEAYRFKKYNETRGWDCLPQWELAAERWIENIGN